MNIKVTLILITSLLCSLTCKADNELTGNINLTFSIPLFDYSCTVVNSSQNSIIDLGEWDTLKFIKVGSRSESIPFSVRLENCNSDFVAVSLVGNSDVKYPYFLALNKNSTAQNIAIELWDENQNFFPINKTTPYVSTTSESAIQFNFSANFISVVKGATPGIAQAELTIVLQYK